MVEGEANAGSMRNGCRHEGFTNGGIPERLNEYLQALFHSVSRSVDLNVRFGIERIALGEDSLKVGHRIVVFRYGAHVALSYYALHVFFWVGFQPHGEATGQQSLERARLGHKAPSCGHNEARIALENVFEALPLELAEAALSMELEDQAQVEPASLFDQAIELEKRHIQTCGKGRSERRFPSSAESDQRDPPMTSGAINSTELTKQQLVGKP